MSVEYIYDITDFPGSEVSLGTLSMEIEASSISVELDYMSLDNDAVSIWFLSALSGPEVTTLDNIVSNHDPVYDPEVHLPIGHSHNFITLFDTPTTYSGEAGKYLRVLTTESGIEFIDSSDVDGIAGYDDANSEDESSTTNTNFQQKLRLSSTTDAGTYIVMWYYEWRYKDGNFEFKAQLQIDDTTTLMEHKEQPTKVSSWAPATGFKRVSLTGAPHDIDLDYSSSKNGKEALIRRARLELWRI